MSRQPLIVYVSGASGAGKTTIANILAEKLFLPHVSSDFTLSGVRTTAGQSIDRKQAFAETYVPLLTYMARAGISFVADSVLYKDVSATDIMAHITACACVVNVHVQSKNPIDRYYARELARTDRAKFSPPEVVKARAEFHKQNLVNTIGPWYYGLPLIEVDTTDDYDPDVTTIVDQIEAAYREGDI